LYYHKHRQECNRIGIFSIFMLFAGSSEASVLDDAFCRMLYKSKRWAIHSNWHQCNYEHIFVVEVSQVSRCGQRRSYEWKDHAWCSCMEAGSKFLNRNHLLTVSFVHRDFFTGPRLMLMSRQRRKGEHQACATCDQRWCHAACIHLAVSARAILRCNNVCRSLLCHRSIKRSQKHLETSL
jgi:hypothetical protein